MKNENHEKIIFFEDLGQFGGFHRIPEVKICLYTKFQVHRRELFVFENFEKTKNENHEKIIFFEDLGQFGGFH